MAPVATTTKAPSPSAPKRLDAATPEAAADSAPRRFAFELGDWTSACFVAPSSMSSIEGPDGTRRDEEEMCLLMQEMALHE